MSTSHTPKGLSCDELHELFELMKHPMISFDCGQLCRDAGGGIPICCDHGNFHPLLFTDELTWLQDHKGTKWKQFKPVTRQDRKEVNSLSDHIVYADCAGIENCHRDHRSLVCRLFPFEPHLDADGKVVALAFITENPKKCPLVAKPLNTFRKKYVRASMTAWQRIVDSYPAEMKLYLSESRKRERRAKRSGKAALLLK